MTTNEMIAIQTHRESSTWYAFADSGEMIATSCGPNSLANSIGYALDDRGMSEAFVDGRICTAAELKNRGW